MLEAILRIIALTRKELLTVLKDPGGVSVLGVAFSPDGKTLATADSDGRTYLWKVG